MGICRAFAFVLRAPDWRAQLAETGVLSVLCPTPGMGLLPFSALLGHLVDIIQNALQDEPEPLPLWDHIGEDVNRDFHVLVALTVRWLATAIIASITPALLALLLLGDALIFPVRGHLLGQFGRQLRWARLAYPRPAQSSLFRGLQHRSAYSGEYSL